MIYSNEELADLMDDGADVIAVDGWCQNSTTTSEGKVCLMGSMYKADGALNLYSRFLALQHDRVVQAARVIKSHLQNKEPADWNDASGRTAGEVQDLLRTVAKELREKK